MRRRWRGRSAALAVVAAALALTFGAAAVGKTPQTLRIAMPDGGEVASVPLPDDGTLTLRYRNSLYGTLAEERFAVTDDGRLRLVALRAEQLAVLEEYYAIDTPARRIGTEGLAWEAIPARGSPIRTLRVAATDLGERTLLVAGHEPVELWRFVEDTAPSVMLEVER